MGFKNETNNGVEMGKKSKIQGRGIGGRQPSFSFFIAITQNWALGYNTRRRWV